MNGPRQQRTRTPMRKGKPVTLENWLKIEKKNQNLVKMIFPNQGVYIKVVDNVENYLNMKFQPKLMQRSRENGQKPIF